MADESSIIINIKAQSDIDEATKQVAQMLQAARELATQSGKSAQANAGLSTSFQQEATAAKKSAASLQEVAKTQNMLTGATTSMRTELRKVQDQLRELADAGDTSSQAFIDLSVKAARMTDTMGDTQAVIKILASDTKNLDTALGVGAGLTGAFTAATSAMALLGGESEELNEAFLKVQAAMSVLNGVQQVAAVLDKRSAVNVVLRTTLTKLFTKQKAKEAAATTAGAAASTADVAAKGAEAVATNAATTATRGLTAALLANPFAAVLVAVTAVVAAVMILKKAFEDTGRSAEEMEAQYDHVNSSMERMAKKGNMAAKIAEAEGKDWKEVMEIRKRNLEAQATYADSEYTKELKKTQRQGHKLTEEEEKHLDDLLEVKKKAHQAVADLNDEYRIKEIEAETKSNADTLAKAKEAAKKRREAAIEQYELELQQKQILANLAKQNAGQKVHDDFGEEEEEPEDIVNPDTYREAMILKAQLEGASEEEIYQIRYASQKKWLQMRMSMEEEGSQKWMELNNQLTELEIENAERARDAQIEGFKEAMSYAQESLNFMRDMMTEVFSALGSSIQSEMDDLNEYYTTDYEEAQKNNKKKYISEEEFAKKKAELELRQQKLNKASALFNIGLSTAMSIMSIWADPTAVWAMKIALTAMASTLGAAQLAVAAAKPLPQYAKGRNGGEGEYALVGEKGAEIMYVPKGASIIPNNKINDPASWGAYGVPALNVPQLPMTDKQIMLTMAMMQANGQIDYDRVGEAIARHMPAQQALSINVDRNGVMVSNGHDSRQYLNTKYSCAW